MKLATKVEGFPTKAWLASSHIVQYMYVYGCILYVSVHVTVFFHAGWLAFVSSVLDSDASYTMLAGLHAVCFILFVLRPVIGNFMRILLVYNV